MIIVEAILIKFLITGENINSNDEENDKCPHTGNSTERVPCFWTLEGNLLVDSTPLKDDLIDSGENKDSEAIDSHEKTEE